MHPGEIRCRPWGFLRIEPRLPIESVMSPERAHRVGALAAVQRSAPGAGPSVRALETAMMRYLVHYNEHCKPFVWTATADAILDKVKRLCERTSRTATSS